MKRRFILSETEQKRLEEAQLAAKNGALRTRYQAVRLYGMGYGVAQIIEITGCSVSRLRAWVADYQREGVGGLMDQRRGGNRARLTDEQVREVGQKLTLYTPAQVLGKQAATADGQFWTVEDLAAAVLQWYGVQYQSRTSYRSLLARCGFSYQKPSTLYHSRKESDVADFAATLEKKGARYRPRCPTDRASGDG